MIVDAGGTNRVDFSLQIGSAAQTVEVQAETISVATETSELSQNFSHQELDQLPNLDRNPLYQMNLIPGANNDVGSGNYGTNGGENGSAVGQTRPQLASIGGVDANANSIYIDGVPNREPQNAYISLIPAIEGVQEVEVYTGKYNAEFGFSGSAVVNITTKSGSNQFHGAAFEFLRNEATDALNYFAGGQPKTPFRRNQFGGAVGGPILKDKLFFFGDYQGTIVNTSRRLHYRTDALDADRKLFRTLCSGTSGRCGQHLWTDYTIPLRASSTPMAMSSAQLHSPAISFLNRAGTLPPRR